MCTLGLMAKYKFLSLSPLTTIHHIFSPNKVPIGDTGKGGRGLGTTVRIASCSVAGSVTGVVTSGLPVGSVGSLSFWSLCDGMQVNPCQHVAVLREYTGQVLGRWRHGGRKRDLGLWEGGSPAGFVSYLSGIPHAWLIHPSIFVGVNVRWPAAT